MFEKIKRWYELGLWKKSQVRMSVNKGVISIQDYKIITGEDF